MLKEENNSTMDTISTLSTLLQKLEGLEQASVLLDSLQHFSGLKKIDDKTNHLWAIESLLLSFLNVIMFRTHPITGLRAVCHMLSMENAFLALLQPKLCLMSFIRNMLQECIVKYFHPGKYYEQLIYPLGDASTTMV
jgi:hypothetical protein